MKTSKSGRTVAGIGIGGWRNLKFSLVFFLCLCSFLAGFFGSTLLSLQDQLILSPRFKPGALKAVAVETQEHKIIRPLTHGVSGEDSFTSVSFQVLSWNPRVLYFPNFATLEQCQSIIKMAKPSLLPSAVVLRKGETEESAEGVRTSSGMFISANEDETGTLAAIEEKLAKVTMIPRSHGEAFNVLRYKTGQRYQSHYDVFSPAEYGPQQSQRVASFLLYMSDVDEGGETVFPFENWMNMDPNYDYTRCDGLKVKPRRGDGLLFYSLHANGTIDPTSLHGSCPVIKGEKWVATKWMRDEIFQG